jgi:hypothetical protein
MTGGFSLVVIPNGSRGFVHKEYMTDQPPPEAKLLALEKSSQQRIADLESRTQEQARQLAALQEEQSLLEAAKQQAEEIAEQQSKIASQLQLKQDGIERDYYLRWFLAGGGVFGIGSLLGWMWGATARRGRQSGLRMGRL